MVYPRSLVLNASDAFAVMAERNGNVPPAAVLVLASVKKTNSDDESGIDYALLIAFWAGCEHAACRLQRWIRGRARLYFKSGGIDDAVQIVTLHILRKKEKLLKTIDSPRAVSVTIGAQQTAVPMLRVVIKRRFIDIIRQQQRHQDRFPPGSGTDPPDPGPRLSRNDAEEMAIRINQVENQRYRVFLICSFWHLFPEHRDLLIRTNSDLAFRWTNNQGRMLAEALKFERDPGESVVHWIARVFRCCADKRTIDSIQKTQARALLALADIVHEAWRRAGGDENTSPEFADVDTPSSGKAS